MFVGDNHSIGGDDKAGATAYLTFFGALRTGLFNIEAVTEELLELWRKVTEGIDLTLPYLGKIFGDDNRYNRGGGFINGLYYRIFICDGRFIWRDRFFLDNFGSGGGGF